MFGVVQFAMLQTDRGSVTYAVQQTARWASVRGAASGAPVDAEAIRKYLCGQAPVLDPARLTVRTEWLPDNQPGSRIQVRAEYLAPIFLRAGRPLDDAEQHGGRYHRAVGGWGLL